MIWRARSEYGNIREMGRKKSGSGTPATEFLSAAGVDHTLHRYDMDELPDSDTYGAAVAAALGVPAERLFKTLLAEVDGEGVVAIVPVSSRLSVKALARAAGSKKAVLMAPADAERLTGYVTGGISPFGQKRSLPTFVDRSVNGFDTVYVSAGRRGLQLEVRADDLLALLGAESADLI